MKWILIGLGAFVLFQVIRNNQSGGSLSDRLGVGSSSGSTATGFINSLASLTNSIGKLFHGNSTTVTDRDALINPSF